MQWPRPGAESNFGIGCGTLRRQKVQNGIGFPRERPNHEPQTEHQKYRSAEQDCPGALTIPCDCGHRRGFYRLEPKSTIIPSEAHWQLVAKFLEEHLPADLPLIRSKPGCLMQQGNRRHQVDQL